MATYSNAKMGLTLALALMNHGSTVVEERGISQQQFGAVMVHRIRNHYRSVSSGKPSGAARAKRIARKNRHIRARSAK